MGRTSLAQTAPQDDWFGRDKALHFGASAGIAAGAYGGTALFTERTGLRLGVSASVAFGAGVGKELWDATGRGDPSFKDLAWDAVGTAAGTLLAYGIDRLVHALLRPTTPPPPTGAAAP